MIDVEIKFTVQEERFLNLKNFTGYPKKSIEYCLRYIKNKNLPCNLVAISPSKKNLYFNMVEINKNGRLQKIKKFNLTITSR